MIPVNALRRLLAPLPIALSLAACQTPPAVYDLAEKTSANTGVFQHRLADLSAGSRALAGQRADLIVSMEAFNVELDGFIKRELYMRQQSASSADWAKIDALMKKLATLRDEIIRIETMAKIAQQDRRQEIVSGQSDLNVNAAAMREAATALNALAKAESSEERARFIGGFLKNVRDEVNAALKKDDKSAQAANTLVNKIKVDLKGAAGTDSNDKSK